jgi:bacterioferritin (cytochrome b1)
MIEGIKVDYETADRITLAVLKEDYQMVRENVQNLKLLKKNGTIADHMKEDLQYDKELLEALKKVLAYYMTADVYDAFIKENV